MDGFHGVFGYLRIQLDGGTFVLQAVVDLLKGIELHILALVTAAFQAALADFRWHGDKFLVGTRALQLMEDSCFRSDDKLSLAARLCLAEHVGSTALHVSHRQYGSLTLQVRHDYRIGILLLQRNDIAHRETLVYMTAAVPQQHLRSCT